MSASEFSSALKNKALTEWFKTEKAGGGSASKAKQEEYSLANPNVLVNPVSMYRAGEQTSEKTAFVITKDTVKDLIVQFHGIEDPKLLQELTDTYFGAFKSKNIGVAVQRKKITVGEGIPAVYFPNISFDSITKLVNNVMNIKSGELQKYYEKGHVIGLTSELLTVTRTRISKVDTTGSVGKSFLLSQLDKVISYYKRLDLASANLRPAENVKLYATFNKRIDKNGSTRYLVELQPKAANQESAREVQSTLGTIRKLFSPGNITEKAVLELIDQLQEKVSDPKFQQDLLEMRSSPSFMDMLAESLVNTLSGKKKTIAYSANNVYVGNKKVKTPNLTKVRQEYKNKIAQAQTLKNKLNKSVPKTAPVFYNYLTSLQALLNAGLSEQIKKNMGEGNRRDVLNLRTGRFAESAKVERLSESRAGMISVFYSYMKNPYQTFEPGFKQGSPASRNPKLLIAKSIREIAGQMVANRLRSVSV